MIVCERGGLTWRQGIGGWWTSVGGVRYRVARFGRGHFRWALYREGRRLEYRGTTFAEVAQRLVSDLCPFDHEPHTPACAADLVVIA